MGVSPTLLAHSLGLDGNVVWGIPCASYIYILYIRCHAPVFSIQCGVDHFHLSSSNGRWREIFPNGSPRSCFPVLGRPRQGASLRQGKKIPEESGIFVVLQFWREAEGRPHPIKTTESSEFDFGTFARLFLHGGESFAFEELGALGIVLRILNLLYLGS